MITQLIIINKLVYLCKKDNSTRNPNNETI